MVDWKFHRIRRKKLGLKNVLKSVSVGQVYGELTVLTDGAGKALVRVRCSCGGESRFTAASVSTGRNKVCPACKADGSAWSDVREWKNPKPAPEADRRVWELKVRKLNGEEQVPRKR